MHAIAATSFEHSVQAFQIVKNALSADGEPSREQVRRVEDAIRRSLHLLRATLDACAARDPRLGLYQ